MQKEKIQIALVDDHSLFRTGVGNLLRLNESFEIVLEAGDGKQYITQQEEKKIDVALIDIHMPNLDGYGLAAWINENTPATNVLVLSMIDKEEAVVKMLRHNIKGFLSKDIEAEELYMAITTIANKGYYYTDYVSGILIDAIDHKKAKQKVENLLSERETHFLQLACSEMTYKEIADKMFLSVKTVDGYRNSLFEKLDVKSRVGLVLYAIKNELVKI